MHSLSESQAQESKYDVELWNSNRQFALTGWRDFSKLDVAKRI